MLNRVILVGRLTRDPDLKYTGTGNPVCSFTLAVDRPFKNAQGQTEADFIRIKVWRKLAEVVAEHTAKGLRVAVDGRLEIRNYEDKEGQKKSATEVIADNVRFIDWKSEQGGEQTQQTPGDTFNNDYPPDDDQFPF